MNEGMWLSHATSLHEWNELRVESEMVEITRYKVMWCDWEKILKIKLSVEPSLPHSAYMMFLHDFDEKRLRGGFSSSACLMWMEKLVWKSRIHSIGGNQQLS